MHKKTIAVFHMLPSGGGIRVTAQFASALKEHFRVDVHRPEGGTALSADLGFNETVYPFPLWKKPSGFLRAIAPLFLVVRLLSFKKVCISAANRINESCDAALVHNCMPVAAPPILNFLEVPSLYYCYEYPRHIYERDIIRRTGSSLADLALKPLEVLEKSIDRKATAGATQTATFSSYMHRRMKAIYKRNSTIIRPGVDTDFFSPGTEKQKAKFVLSVGALWPFKGHERVIRILSLIPSAKRPVLRISADREYPGYGNKLKTLADQLSVELIIDRKISNNALLELYRKAQAVICCQIREPYGLVPLEAMACGTPVIAVKQGGFTDNIVHGEYGFLFDGTAQAGADILSWVTDRKNGDKVAKVVENGLEFIGRERNLQSGVPLLASLLESM